MTRISRHNFLQFAIAALVALGIHPLAFQRRARGYGQILARRTSRKLALLVGINSYPDQPLDGCVNDTELQRQLLVHRFGFNPKDILILNDGEATRRGILTAFEEHLIKQAKPGDVVVYHYSGHGSRIFDPHPIVPRLLHDGTNGTFVPVDSNLPAGYPYIGGSVQDIMGHTLFLLMSALNTEDVTVVLDSCFSGGATRDARVRSREGGKKVLVSRDEKTYQEQWLSRLGMSPEDFVKAYRAGVAKGMVLAAAAPDQLAREVNINGFTAGIFSYLLTHYLWQEDRDIEGIFEKILPEIPQNFNQLPLYEMKAGSMVEEPLYFIDSPNSIAEAVVTEVRGSRALLWLGGVDLRKVNAGTLFREIGGRGRVRVVSRDGMVAEAKVEESVREGTPLLLLV